MLSLDELTTPLTRKQVEASVYRVMATVGVNTTGWKPGGVMRAFVTAFGVFGASITSLIALIAKSGFLELAEGNWLEIIAIYVYGLTEGRRRATFATQYVTLANTGGGDYSWDVGELAVANPSNGKIYRNLEPVTSNHGTTVQGLMRAVEAGAGSNAQPGQVTVLQVSAENVAVYNTAPFQGLDDETDPELRTRCREKPESLSPFGARGVYATIAKTAKRVDGSAIGVNRVKVSRSSPNGQVTVTCAIASGTLAEEDRARIEYLLKELGEPEGVTVTVVAATPYLLDVTYHAWAYADIGLTEAQWLTLIRQSLQAFALEQPIGGTVIPGESVGHVYRTGIIGTIKSVRTELFRAEVALPTGDLTLAATDVLQIGAVSGQVTRVQR